MTRLVRAHDVQYLQADAVYLTPTGRSCRWQSGGENCSGQAEAHFAYDTPTGRAARGSMSDGFSLLRANWWMLRRVA